MRKVSRTRGGVVHRSGLRLRGRDEVGHVLVSLRRRDHEHRRHVAERDDGREVAQGIERQVAVCGWHDGVRGRVDQDGVAVGVRSCRGGHADGVAGAGAIFHHDRLAELLRKLIQNRAPDHVGGAARGERHDCADRFRRPVLRDRGARAQRGENEGRNDAAGRACSALADANGGCADAGGPVARHDSSRELFLNRCSIQVIGFKHLCKFFCFRREPALSGRSMPCGALPQRRNVGWKGLLDARESDCG